MGYKKQQSKRIKQQIKKQKQLSYYDKLNKSIKDELIKQQ